MEELLGHGLGSREGKLSFWIEDCASETVLLLSAFLSGDAMTLLMAGSLLGTGDCLTGEFWLESFGKIVLF